MVDSKHMDSFGRKIDYLRISITDRCNERCLYCMPEGYAGWERRKEHLSAVEIIRIAKVAAGLGFRKFRLTGGEPLVRGDVVEIARGLAAIPGVEVIGLSTNGTRLAGLAQSLRDAGVRTANVSLDALTPHPVYAWMGWVQILSPTASAYAETRPLIEEAHRLAVAKFAARRRLGTRSKAP